MRLCVVDGELLKRRAGHAQSSRVFFGAVNKPKIDHQPLEKPHRGRAATTRAMNECRVAAFRGDRVQKLVGHCGIGRGAAEGDGVKTNIGGLACGFLDFEVCAIFACLPQIDDLSKTKQLDFWYRGGLDGPGAGNCRLKAMEIRYAIDVFLGHFLRPGRRPCQPDA